MRGAGMEQITDNMQKYANYKTQMGRLNKALTKQFYLEAIFIEYAIMEDRLESILRHSGKWNPKPGAFVSLDAKRKNVAKLAEERKLLAHKYFPVELTDSIESWKNKRNGVIHALMKKNLHTGDLREIAEDGQHLVKTLCGKTTLYNRALERQAVKKEK
jgi:hypothetical protein